MKTVFLNALGAKDKSRALLAALNTGILASPPKRFERDVSAFSVVPGSPFIYWLVHIVGRLFESLDPLESHGRINRVGLQTSDNVRFLRAWYEVSSHAVSGDFVAYAKGGGYSPYYRQFPLVLNWRARGHEVKAWAETLGYSPSRNVRSEDLYFRPSLTYSDRCTGGLAVSPRPLGGVFDVKGSSIFVDGDSPTSLLATMAVTLSKCFASLVAIRCGTTQLAQSFQVGQISTTPFPTLSVSDIDELSRLGRRAWSLKRSLDIRTEVSHAFTLPALLQVEGATIDARTEAWAEQVRSAEAALAIIQNEIDERCFDLYAIDAADRRGFTEVFGGTDGSTISESAEPDTGVNNAVEDENEGETETRADATSLTAELVSWAVGVAFGRFDVRRAISVRPLPHEPEPFDPLPVCSPAMLTGDDGLPLDRAPGNYPLTFPESGILVDDPGHPRDLATAVRAVLDSVFGADSDAWWDEAAALLDSKGYDLRAWLASSFFDHHLKRYSASRRKAPILWQLGIPSGRYSVWLYAHRLTRDSLFQIQNDVVAPKLAHEEQQLANLTQGAGTSPSAKDRKEIAGQETLVEELRALLDEVKRVTPLWNPTFDDGVVLTMALLWRLVPQHKSWQKELKNNWDQLAAGRYDWAHVAMHLWPERVVPKCATDRSLAIAHELEETFWVESTEGKWEPRSTPKRPTNDLVRERTSPAVKAALNSLFETPAANAGSGRRPDSRVRNTSCVGAIR